jgi:hypothetical protein
MYGSRRGLDNQCRRNLEEQDAVEELEKEYLEEHDELAKAHSRFTDEAFAHLNETKKHHDENGPPTEIISCDEYSKRVIKCQYMAITHPHYHGQCAVLGLMTEMCHQTQHMVMAQNSNVPF